MGPELFAIRITAFVVLAATAATVSIHLLLNAFGLLPYPVVPAMTVGTCVAVAVSGPITFIICLVIGRAIRDLAINRDAFQSLSTTDALSGLSNRRAFFETLELSDDAALILFDVDHFKEINDRFGHAAGDEAIQGISDTLRKVFQRFDVLIARVGGEEFGVVLPNQSLEAALCLAEEVQLTLFETALSTKAGKLPLTLSGGVGKRWLGRSVDDLYRRCDEALYQAKREGRNRIVTEVASTMVRL